MTKHLKRGIISTLTIIITLTLGFAAINQKTHASIQSQTPFAIITCHVNDNNLVYEIIFKDRNIMTPEQLQFETVKLECGLGTALTKDCK